MTEQTSDPLVTAETLRDAGMCVRGAKQWASLHGLDFTHFMRHGYPASTFEALHDALGDKIASIAREQAAEELE